MPVPTAVKMAKMTVAGWLRANATAVPRNGAEQGVAISVAKRPETRWPATPSRGPVPAARATNWGSGISNSPQRLRQNSTTTTSRKVTKTGFWNWTPQPTAAPAARATTAVPARAQNESTMPAAVARAPPTTAERPWPALLTRPKTLSERTGRTHGMAFKIRPPRTPRASMARRLWPVAGAAGRARAIPSSAGAPDAARSPGACPA